MIDSRQLLAHHYRLNPEADAKEIYMNTMFDDSASANGEIKRKVEEFLNNVSTMERKNSIPIFILQDGVKKSYYIKCSISADEAARLCDLDAKLDVDNPESFRANRQLLLTNNTYLKMEQDAAEGREFHDIIVEYNTDYQPERPLKVWGGQHRTSAITKAGKDKKRYHGFRVYFSLNKDQRTELALTSNTNISVSNDTFDRMVEETLFGDTLRKWCQKVGLLKKGDDFPDVGSRSESINVKRARSFVVNFYLGKERGSQLQPNEIDHHVYDPYLPITGTTVDPQYERVVKSNNILEDAALIKAGQRFAALHNAQFKAVTTNSKKIRNKKVYRNKAFVESILCGWSYVAGLLQVDPGRLENHYKVPRTNSKVPDPLNAEEMSQFKHDSDPPTYRGLGTRSAIKDRQRIAQLFLAKSREDNMALDKKVMSKAVSQVVGLLALSKGYS